MPSLTNIKTPGVYVQEVSKFPPSIAAVETAIPAFVGYTEKALRKEESLWGVPYRITSMVDFENLYGGAQEEEFEFNVDVDPQNGNIQSITTQKGPAPGNNLYYALQMFFANGGGPCYIVAVGPLIGEIKRDALIKGIDAVRRTDEVTLIVVPESVNLSSVDDYAAVMNHALAQCTDLQDRFAILDVPYDLKDPGAYMSSITAFRSKISSDLENVKYGGAYFPHLETVLNYNTSHSKIKINTYTLDGRTPDQAAGDIIDDPDANNEQKAEATAKKAAIAEKKPLAEAAMKKLNGANALAGEVNKAVTAALAVEDPVPVPQAVADAAKGATGDNSGTVDPLIDEALAAMDPIPADATDDAKQRAARELATEISNLVKKASQGLIKAAQKEVTSTFKAQIEAGDYAGVPLDVLKGINSLMFNAVMQKIQSDHRVVLPSGSTIAGVFARVDNTRGVWKAPANVSANRVIRPMINISDEDQEILNVDPTSGKSVNVIRTFVGKGNLVWGARTLAGNDNEWRYVSVRRFFNFVEESVKKGTARFVFEPNDANTWVKVRAMIENFLNLQWRAGALAGPTPDAAFYVRVGLNETMTFDDVLNGFMIVEIGMAAVRPAEFIVLRFSHKMQEA